MRRTWQRLIALLAPLTLLALVFPASSSPAQASSPSLPSLASLSLPSLLANLVHTANLLPGLSQATLISPASPNTLLTVDFGLGTANASAESSTLANLYEKGSASYHQFLTPTEFNSEFGIPAATVSATKVWLHSAGLTPSYVSGSGNLLAVRGTVAQLGSLLHTTFGQYKIGTYSFVANQSQPQVPSALTITDVVGLNTLERSYTQQQLRQPPDDQHRQCAACHHRRHGRLRGHAGAPGPVGRL